MTLAVTLLCALLTGFTGGWLARGRKRRPMPPSGSAFMEARPYWGNWNAETGKKMEGYGR